MRGALAREQAASVDQPSAGKGLRADRERTLLWVAYDTMARRSELVALEIGDLTIAAHGAGTALAMNRRQPSTTLGNCPAHNIRQMLLGEIPPSRLRASSIEYRSRVSIALLQRYL